MNTSTSSSNSADDSHLDRSSITVALQCVRALDLVMGTIINTIVISVIIPPFIAHYHPHIYAAGLRIMGHLTRTWGRLLTCVTCGGWRLRQRKKKKQEQIQPRMQQSSSSSSSAAAAAAAASKANPINAPQIHPQPSEHVTTETATTAAATATTTTTTTTTTTAVMVPTKNGWMMVPHASMSMSQDQVRVRVHESAPVLQSVDVDVDVDAHETKTAVHEIEIESTTCFPVNVMEDQQQPSKTESHDHVQETEAAAAAAAIPRPIKQHIIPISIQPIQHNPNPKRHLTPILLLIALQSVVDFVAMIQDSTSSIIQAVASGWTNLGGDDGAYCQMSGLFTHSICTQSIANLFLITLERYRSVNLGHKPTIRSVICSHCACWIASFGVNIMPVATHKLGRYVIQPNRIICISSGRSVHTILILVIVVCIMYSFILLGNVLIIAHVRAVSRRTANMFRTPTTSTLTPDAIKVQNYDQRVAIILMRFVLLFGLIWSTTAAGFLYSIATGAPRPYTLSIIEYVLVPLSFWILPLISAASVDRRVKKRLIAFFTCNRMRQPTQDREPKVIPY